ncbi:hypothetical protein [Nitrosospira sp. NRS527]|uniref:hypothetical protein n=1 Tax=Nitrosospira sp. NRS527 TaxID=155925 RepID=UPI001AFB8906|nr:hypothetical protein [Nitrosospira sp. NRS527]BCT67369.1 hypothetical protein NNRS527_00951 [Nitrosospira sp. NRS527]
MALKAGSVADFSSSLAAAMEQAMKTEWQAVKGVALPNQGEEDRRLLFVAIARGLFDFLKEHEDEFITNITLREPGASGTDENFLVTQLELNL